MVNLHDLLRRGYFPKELPPPFGTSSYAREVADRLVLEGLTESFSKSSAAEYAPYNLARAGSLRRRLALLNPILYFNLCRDVESHWPTISGELKKTPLAGIIET